MLAILLCEYVTTVVPTVVGVFLLTVVFVQLVTGTFTELDTRVGLLTVENELEPFRTSDEIVL